MCVCVCEGRPPSVCALGWRINSFRFCIQRGNEGERETGGARHLHCREREVDRGRNGEMEINSDSEDKGV